MKRTAEECYEQMCGTNDGLFTDEEFLDTELMTACDQLMFLCEVCDWWCDRDEEGDSDICQGCFRDDSTE